MPITNKQLNTKLDKIIELLEVKNLSQVSDELITITDDGTKKTSEILNECRKQFSVYSYLKDLDKDFPPVKTNRKFKYVRETDEDLKNKSANELEKEGIQGITLRERLLFELEYFKREGKHLDIDNITICSGSCCSDGSVPGVDWYDGRLRIGWCAPGDCSDSLRARQAV